jgi:hypothetical protein
MNPLIIKFLGFFIGLFMILIIINYFNLKDKKIEPFQTSIPNEIKSATVLNNNADIPFKTNKYMCINTYNDIKTSSNSEGRWYECDLSVDLYNKIEVNERQYISYTSNINLKPNSINPEGAYGADINKIELMGPKSFYFSNNVNTNELTEFSILMTMKIKEIKPDIDNIIFEMRGNTETIMEDNKPTYIPSTVNINIRTNRNNNYDIIITIGNTIYKGRINNIDKNLLISNTFTIMGLTYTDKKVKFILGNQIFNYETDDKFKVKLGSSPLIINKNGVFNMELYNFIYYKTELPDTEFEKYNQYNFYYLSGLYKAQLATIKAQETKVNETEQKLLDLDEKINKTLNNVPTTTTPEKTTESSNIPIPSASFKTINQLNLTPMNDDENIPFSFIMK